MRIASNSIIRFLYIILGIAGCTSTVAQNFSALPCSSDPSIVGHENATTLLTEMMLRGFFGLPMDFILCPNTVFAFDDFGNNDFSLAVLFNDTTVSCGYNGSSRNNCVLQGGNSHVYVAANNVIFEGVTFSGAEFVSIVAAGRSDQEVYFKDCIWENNTGPTVIFSENFHEEELDDDTGGRELLDMSILEEYLWMLRDLEGENFNDYGAKDFLELVPFPRLHSIMQRKLQFDPSILPPTAGPGMKSFFSRCTFRNNTPVWFVMTAFDSELSVYGSLFDGNSPQMSTIALTSGSKGKIRKTCFFTEEHEPDLSAVFVDKNSTLVVQKNNYGIGSLGSFCDHVLKEDLGHNCLDPSLTCSGSCDAFGSECMSPIFMANSAANIASTIAPSMLLKSVSPTITPSLSIKPSPEVSVEVSTSSAPTKDTVLSSNITSTMAPSMLLESASPTNTPSLSIKPSPGVTVEVLTYSANTKNTVVSSSPTKDTVVSSSPTKEPIENDSPKETLSDNSSGSNLPRFNSVIFTLIAIFFFTI